MVAEQYVSEEGAGTEAEREKKHIKEKTVRKREGKVGRCESLCTPAPRGR